jgi:hypothetical protein
MKIICDSQSTIFLVKNPSYHYNNKNIDVQYHLVRYIEINTVLLEKVDTLENKENYFTKSMTTVKFS